MAQHELIFRGADNGVTIPSDVLLHEYVLERRGEGNDAVAFLDGVTGKSLTFCQTRNLMLNIAAGLSSIGIRHKDVVMLLLPNMPEYAPLFLGINRAGAVATTANPAYTPEELARQAADSGAKLVITTSDLLAKTSLMSSRPLRISFGSKVPPGVIPVQFLFEADGRMAPSTKHHSQSDACALPYSSGTTGVAKGVVLSHRNFIANIQQQVGGFSPRLPWGEGDTLLGVLPMFHIYGLNVLCLCPVRAGARVITLPRFDMELVLGLIQRERITVAPIVPPVVLGLIKLPMVKKYDLSSLRLMISGAAPLDATTEMELQRKFPKCHVGQGFGMTELSPVATVSQSLSENHPTHKSAPGSAGTLVPLTEAKIVDLDNGSSLGIGQCGELWVRGPQVMQGYLNNPKATAETLTSDGWLKTGDIGYFDDQGNLFLVDRAKELIKYKGFQVPPAELEGILISHPCVADAAVVAAKDENAGEVPVAFVVLRQNASVSASELMQYAAVKVAPYKRLASLTFVDIIPKSASGKILRKELRARL